MIKINLLPPKKKKALIAGQRHLAMIFGVLLVECLLLAWVYTGRNSTLEAQEDANKAKAKEVTRLKEEIGDLDRLKAERTELEKQQEILDSLEQARSGPVRVLEEVAFLTSPASSDKGQTELLRRNLNTTWDPRRITLLAFEEKDRLVHLRGFAKTNDDVAEFMKRLDSSVHFNQVQLNFTKVEMTANQETPPSVKFDITCRISYTGKESEEVPVFQVKGRG
ncbi:MAG: PilN domain-containing protein [Myxococcota bacterium]|jgi:type IV pilus assembly protein PilN|nr:PilN domain-containing protein [Myxococcota bacterium]